MSEAGSTAESGGEPPPAADPPEADLLAAADQDAIDVFPAESDEGSLRDRVVEFLGRVYDKAGDDDVFFMAGAISFNVLLAFVPILLLAVGVSGIVLSARVDNPAGYLIGLLSETMPAMGGDVDFRTTVENEVRTIMEGRTGLTVVGAVLLVWFSTRLVGSLRIALREVFDIAHDRGVLGGKIYDAQVVVVGSVLFLLNLGVTTLVTAVQAYGVSVLGLTGEAVSIIDQAVAFSVAFLSIWLLFLGVYRYLPARPIPWRTALIAATFTAVSHEVLKLAFSWYATEIANYRTTYGNLVTLAALFLWIYYEAIVFILGGEVAQVWTMRRARRVKTRRALFGSDGSDGVQRGEA